MKLIFLSGHSGGVRSYKTQDLSPNLNQVWHVLYLQYKLTWAKHTGFYIILLIFAQSLYIFINSADFYMPACSLHGTAETLVETDSPLLKLFYQVYRKAGIQWDQVSRFHDGLTGKWPYFLLSFQSKKQKPRGRGSWLLTVSKSWIVRQLELNLVIILILLLLWIWHHPPRNWWCGKKRGEWKNSSPYLLSLYGITDYWR